MSVEDTKRRLKGLHRDGKAPAPVAAPVPQGQLLATMPLSSFRPAEPEEPELDGASRTTLDSIICRAGFMHNPHRKVRWLTLYQELTAFFEAELLSEPEDEVSEEESGAGPEDHQRPPAVEAPQAGAAADAPGDVPGGRGGGEGPKRSNRGRRTFPHAG